MSTALMVRQASAVKAYQLAENQRETPASLALYAAAKEGSVEGVGQALATGAYVNFFKEDEEGRTPLHAAAEQGHAAVVQALLAAEASPQLKVMTSKVTPMHLAIINGHREVYDLLAEKGLALMEENAFGNTPLHIAAVRGNVAIMRDLMQRGADVGRRNHQGAAPALMGCFSDGEPVEVVHVLVCAGADVNVVDVNNITPIMAAVQHRDVELAQYFLSHGADVRIPDRFGKTVQDYADLSGLDALIALVQEAVALQTAKPADDEREGPKAGKRIEDAIAFAHTPEATPRAAEDGDASQDAASKAGGVLAEDVPGGSGEAAASEKAAPEASSES